MKRAVGPCTIAAAAATAFGVAACNGDTTPVGGLVVYVSLDPSLAPIPLTAFEATVGASLDGGGPIYFDGGFPVADAVASPRAVRFPTTFAIDSNGDPGATVAIDLSIWDGAQQVERQRFLVNHVPTTTVGELTVVFGSACGASGPPAGAETSCPLSDWCHWGGSYWTCNGGRLPPPGTDAGWPERGVDATTDAGSDVGIDAATDARAFDASADQTVSDADAGGADSEAEDAPADAEVDADAEATDSSLPMPCPAPCGVARTCVNGQCVASPPSCAGGGPGAGPSCGLGGTDDCCASDEVHEGGFFRDYDGHTYSDRSWPATVSRFRLDRYEVTVGRFRAFVGDVVARGWLPPKSSGRHTYLNDDAGLNSGGDAGTVYETGWDPSWNMYVPQTKVDWDTQLRRCVRDGGLDERTWTTDAGGNEDLPLDCVSWYQAYAFCIWDGGFLPSDTEWDYAAAGGNNQWEYPWGDFGPGANAMYAIYNCYYPQMPQGNDCQGLANIAPVGSAPAGRALWGQLDLAGNVLEWTLDYGSASASPPLPCHDCAQTAAGIERSIRGGGYFSNDRQLFSAVQLENVPDPPPGDVGFRCARAP